ncbi:MAG: gluconate 2-dehydrogenase subunit 3 family protein [Pseudomonadota bacterium]
MENEGRDRRIFLKGVVAGGTVAVGSVVPQAAQAQAQPAAPAAAAAAADLPAGYTFLSPDEGAFIEAVVDHMIPADPFTPKGTDLGVHIYIDRALSSGWGKGERLYRQGPWKLGTGNQGYQLSLTPSELYRAAIPAVNAQCVKQYGKTFDKVTAEQREAFLVALQGGKVVLENGPPARTFFNMLYQNVMEGMFSDPIYGGNKDKAGWKLVGFGGVVAVHQQNVEKYRGKQFPINPLGIADMS